MEEKTVDIEQVMQQIRKRAEEISYEQPVAFEAIPAHRSGDSAPGDKFDAAMLSWAQVEMNSGSDISFYRPIFGGKIATFFKKVVRKLLFFLLDPMSEDITAYNRAATLAVNQLSAYVSEQEERNRALQATVERLEGRLAALEAKASDGSGAETV